MPSPYHKCANPDCSQLVNPRATYCRKHTPHTAEHIEKVAARNRGKKRSLAVRLMFSIMRCNRVKVICQQCQTTFDAKPSAVKKGEAKYCTPKCTYTARSGQNSPMWKGGETSYICDQCGNPFSRASCFVKGEHHFCNYSCRSLYNKAHQKNKDTKIERAIRELLLQTGLLFQEQVTLCNVTIADFYLPLDNIAIFCDGDYWHSMPDRVERDHRQTETLESNGIKVLRFREATIKKNPKQCLSAIQSARCATR